MPSKKKPDTIYQDPAKLKTTRSGFITPHIVHTPWGQEELIVLTDRYVAKILTIEPGHKLSVQYHEHKCETLRCIGGSGWAHLGKKSAPKRLKKTPFKKGMIVHITPGTVHTHEARTRLTLLEVSTPEIWDVVRLHDTYGRSTPAGAKRSKRGEY